MEKVYVHCLNDHHIGLPIDEMIEETKEWFKIHMEAGREIESAACQVRLEELERVKLKKHKPALVENWIKNTDLKRLRARTAAQSNPSFYDESFYQRIRLNALASGLKVIKA